MLVDNQSEILPFNMSSVCIADMSGVLRTSWKGRRPLAKPACSHALHLALLAAALYNSNVVPMLHVSISFASGLVHNGRHILDRC